MTALTSADISQNSVKDMAHTLGAYFAGLSKRGVKVDQQTQDGLVLLWNTFVTEQEINKQDNDDIHVMNE